MSKVMTDPWADVRNRMRMTRRWKADPATKKQMMEDIQDVGRLLADADALLAAGHSMDCDVRKDSATTPDCSCGWTERMSHIALPEDGA